MTSSIQTAPHLKSQKAIIEGIERGLADIQAGRTINHEVAMASLRKMIDAEAWLD